MSAPAARDDNFYGPGLGSDLYHDERDGDIIGLYLDWEYTDPYDYPMESSYPLDANQYDYDEVCSHGVDLWCICYRCDPDLVGAETEQAYAARMVAARAQDDADEALPEPVSAELAIVAVPVASQLSSRGRRCAWLRAGRTRRYQNHGTSQPVHERDWRLQWIGKVYWRRQLRHQNADAAGLSQLADQFGQGDIDAAFDQARIEDEERAIWRDFDLDYNEALRRNLQKNSRHHGRRRTRCGAPSLTNQF